MSYDRTNPTYYQTYAQGTPLEAGAPGWTKAPWPAWGNNPNLAGRRMLATDGLGSVVAISGLGAEEQAVSVFTGLPLQPVPLWSKLLSYAAGSACAYHGYLRNQESLGWGVAWSFFGSTLPLLALPIAIAQGFGKPRQKVAMAPNRRRHNRRRRTARRTRR